MSADGVKRNSHVGKLHSSSMFPEANALHVGQKFSVMESTHLSVISNGNNY